MSDQNQRVSEIIKDVMMNLSERLKGVEHQGKSMENQINIFQPRLFAHLKSKCQSELEWLETYGKFIEKEGKISVEVQEDQKDVS